MKTKILIDHSNIVHMAYHRAMVDYTQDPDHNSITDLFASAFRSKLKVISHSITKLNVTDSETIFVADENSVRKMLLYPSYKAHRVHNDKVPVDFGLELVRSLAAGAICRSPMNEADDCIATLCVDDRNIIVTRDRDMWQLIDPQRVLVLNPKSLSLVNVKDIQDGFSVSEAIQIVLCKTVWGDSGDGVPNIIPRMQKSLLPLIRKSDGTLDDLERLIKEDWHSLTQKCQRLYLSAKDQLQINYQLVKLDTDCFITWD
jgi:5'-3' exonuclease